jgi:hypothetical protein
MLDEELQMAQMRYQLANPKAKFSVSCLVMNCNLTKIKTLKVSPYNLFLEVIFLTFWP